MNDLSCDADCLDEDTDVRLDEMGHWRLCPLVRGPLSEGRASPVRPGAST